MNFPSFLPTLVRFLAVAGLISFLGLPLEIASANNSVSQVQNLSTISFLKITHSDSLILTEQKVSDWIKTRIDVAKLQNKMKANAGDFDNVVQEFYSKRASLLESRGWVVEEFEAAKNRIHAAISAMDTAEELKESKKIYEEQVTQIKANEYYSDVQKGQMIKALENLRQQKNTRYIEPTKADWPAVKPYRSVFRQMTHWIAGNTPHPPVVE